MTKKTTDKKSLLIGLDLGTSATKGVVIDCTGKIITEESQPVSYLTPQAGWVELDPKKHYKDICEVIKKLAESVNGKISAISVAAASGNTLLCDKNGKPLTNIISWLDHRCIENTPETLKNLTAESVRQVVGWGCINTFSLAHLSWLKENKSGIYKSAEKICMNTDWLIYKLTGNWMMDHSTATTFHLQNQLTGKYHKPYLDLVGITENKLSTLTNSGTPCGKLTPQAQKDTGLTDDTEIVTGSFDHPSGARAMGIFQSGKLMLSCGTSWVGFYPENNRDKIISKGILCDTFLSEKGGPWGAIFSVPYIGQNIDWYVHNVIAPDKKNPFEVFDKLAGESCEDTGGIKIDLTQKPQMISGDKKHISRAVMENAAKLLNNKLAALCKNGLAIKSAVMIGGPTKSRVWPGIISKITGLEISTGQHNAGAIGAALLAGIGAGIYKDEFDAYEQAGAYK